MVSASALLALLAACEAPLSRANDAGPSDHVRRLRHNEAGAGCCFHVSYGADLASLDFKTELKAHQPCLAHSGGVLGGVATGWRSSGCPSTARQANEWLMADQDAPASTPGVPGEATGGAVLAQSRSLISHIGAIREEAESHHEITQGWLKVADGRGEAGCELPVDPLGTWQKADGPPGGEATFQLVCADGYVQDDGELPCAAPERSHGPVARCVPSQGNAEEWRGHIRHEAFYSVVMVATTFIIAVACWREPSKDEPVQGSKAHQLLECEGNDPLMPPAQGLPQSG